MLDWVPFDTVHDVKMPSPIGVYYCRQFGHGRRGTTGAIYKVRKDYSLRPSGRPP